MPYNRLHCGLLFDVMWATRALHGEFSCFKIVTGEVISISYLCLLGGPQEKQGWGTALGQLPKLTQLARNHLALVCSLAVAYLPIRLCGGHLLV
jgi:hypothetical protein